jgi:hypothetical protein
VSWGLSYDRWLLFVVFALIEVPSVAESRCFIKDSSHLFERNYRSIILVHSFDNKSTDLKILEECSPAADLVGALICLEEDGCWLNE